MPTWSPHQYLKFKDERTQPCRDLVARIALENPARIVDLGCGPGNSTAVLAARWPAARLTGIDQSADMIGAARKEHPGPDWRQADLATWSADPPPDLIFSNAALHWVGNHARLLPRLFAQVAPGGALAWQVPANLDAVAHRLMRELAAAPAWRSHFTETVRAWHAHAPAFYYDLLAPVATRIEIWNTEYIHILESPAAIVEWYRGSGLRPFLDRLPAPADRDRFLADYLIGIERAFPRQPDGRVLFPFLRLFAIAYRG
jgi:trans-aconitate 2-methyltransferase